MTGMSDRDLQDSVAPARSTAAAGAAVLPGTWAALPSGVLADLYDRRLIMLVALPGMTPAMQSTVPDLVSREALPGALALNGISSSAARSVGPGFAGLLIGLVERRAPAAAGRWRSPA